MSELVSVVVPAYNAAATIEATMRSILGQSYKDLEVIVVDDGSRDDTLAILAPIAATDARVRIVQQPNGGVARARNRGIAEARGDFIAPVDADDLWRFDKIQRQMEVMRAAGPEMGLVYTWFAIIDANDMIMHLEDRTVAEGDVLHALAERNFIGNGSSVLMRRDAVLACGGYDPSLRDRKAQGCEDYKLYLQIAENHKIGLVADYLTGYRQLPQNMSSDVMQMLRSRELCLAEFARRRPDMRRIFHKGRNRLTSFMLHRVLKEGRWRAAAQVYGEMLRFDPLYAIGAAASLPIGATQVAWKRLKGRLTKSAGTRFAIGMA
jgi:glycosyltransferase involved in cell wall biosynthesis